MFKKLINSEKTSNICAILLVVLFTLVAFWVYFFKANIINDLRFDAWDVYFEWIPFKDTFLKDPFDPMDLLVEFLNVFGFALMGFIVYPVFKKWPLVFSISYCVLFSIFIETMQLGFCFGTPIISDILLNTLGGVIGALLAHKFIKKIPLKTKNILYIIMITLCIAAIIIGIIFTIKRWPEYTSMIRQ